VDTLGKILYLLRKNGISEMEFANKLSISRSTVTDWKRGKTKSYNKRLPKIAEILGVDTDYLIDTNDIFTPFNKVNEEIANVEDENINPYLSEEEKILVNNFRKLDHRGKIRVQNFVYEEIDYMDKKGESIEIEDFRADN